MSASAGEGRLDQEIQLKSISSIITSCSIHHILRMTPQIPRGAARRLFHVSLVFYSPSSFLQLLVSHSTFHLIALLINTNTNRSYETLVRRWPVVLTLIIDNLYRVGHDLATQPHDLPPTVAEERIAAAKAVIEKISKIKYEMGRDKPLLYGPVYQLLAASAMQD